MTGAALQRRITAMLLAAALGAAAPLAAQGVSSASVITPRLVADSERLVPGMPFRLALIADIKSGWHVNSHTPKEDYLIPTQAGLKPSPGLVFQPAAYPKHLERKFSFSEQPLAVYEGRTVFRMDGTVDAAAAPGPRTLTGTLEYQPCNDQQCLPPTKIQALLTIEVAAAGSAAKPANADVFPTSGPAAGAAPPKADAGPSPTDDGSGFGAGSTALRQKWAVQGVPTILFLGPDGKEQADRVIGFEPPAQFLKKVRGGAPTAAGGLAGKSLPLLLGLVFVSGLALNLTPCVYPLIPITIGFFSRQSAGKPGRTFGLALAYVLGMSVTYSALGVFAALSGSLFGAWLQKPVVLLAIAAVVVALALSMFGLFEIQVPHFITDRTGSKGGTLGALTMGLFVGFVAAPCIGPFVLSLLTYVAAKGSAALGFGLFFTLAMGLGLPYLILGTAAGALRKLPRSGDWMVSVLKLFGFALLALAVYFVRSLLPERTYEVLIAIPLVVGGAYFLFFEKTGAGLGWFKALKVAAALGLLVAGAVFAIPQAKAPGLAFATYTDAAVAAARADGKPVMIDFYADWCLPCKELDHKTFTDPKVIEALKGWVLLKADLTR